MARTPVHEMLEGWLQKKKSSAAVFSNNRRWFNIREVKGSSDQVELALCYYKSQRDKEAKGWVFLKDVAELADDEKALTIITPARTMTLEAASSGEHRLWLQGLVQLCPHAVTARIKSKDITRPAMPALAAPRSRSVAATSTSAEAKVLRCLDQPSKEEKMRENILPPDDVDATTVNSGSSRGSSSRGSSRAGAKQQSEKHDHRKAAFRSGLSPQAGTTQRIWGHIRMQGADSAAQAKASDEESATAAGGRLDKEDEGRGLLAAPFPHPVSDPSLEDLETMGSIDPTVAARLAARERREHKGRGRQTGRSDRRRDSDSDTEDEVEVEAEAGRRVLPAESRAESKGEAGAVVSPVTTTATAPAPPRRARDLMADPAARAQRPSIDELLAQRDTKRSSRDEVGESESDRHEVLLDLQLAKLRYSLLSPEDGEQQDSKHEAPAPVPVSRPPRPPAVGPTSTSPNLRPSEQRWSSAMDAPVGLPADPNFATENWDQDSSGFGDSPPVRRIVRASKDKRAMGGGIDPDANWLESDFDK